MLFLLPGISYAASLTWTGGESSEWNTVHRNWNGSEVFQTGDDVSFGSGKRIFIGVNGTPQAVSPGSIVTAGAVTFWGGDILTGGIIHTSGPTGLTFSNYTTSLSFPGGLRILNGAKVVYDVREAPNGAEFHLGTGPILFENGTLRLRAAADKIATLSNPLVISNSGGIEMDAAGATSGPVRFSGAIDLYGTMTILSLGSNRFAADQLTGPLRIKYRPPGVSVYFNGNLGSRSIELSGPIINDFPPGPLPASTILSLENHGLDGVRITGTNNTYTGGTRIWSSSAPNSAIEVAAQSSLGLGNVEVSGFLRLKGSRNMGTNALLLINEGGQVYLDEGVKLRLRGLRLGSTFYSRGRFTSNNAAPYIRGPGEVRLPHYNLPPTIEPIETGPRTVYAGADVPFTVTANDPDGEVVKVGFAFYENILIREVTRPPWTYTVSNTPPEGIWYNRAFAFDDDGAYTGTGFYSVTAIEPPAPRLLNPRKLNGDSFAFDFNARNDTRYSVEIMANIASETWSNVYLLPTPTTPGLLTVTNLIPDAEPYRWFRIRAGYQPYFLWAD